MAEALRASVRYEAAYQRRLTRHKAQYPLDCEDGIEYSACLHELPRKFWSSRSGLSVFGTPSTPCRKSRAAGSMPTSFLAKALKRLPRPRVCMRSPSASLSSGAYYLNDYIFHTTDYLISYQTTKTTFTRLTFT